ncbi:MAG: nitrate reductase associated protein [Leptolyngbyaceae bacterium]|nr:nitrate reductase associated protein [Leptolyngbyaceae bacterium]
MTLFQFEADFVDSLRCIPMVVRYKLDTCGVKLKLEHWNSFSDEEKQLLVDKLCEPGAEAIAYRDYLQQLVTEHTGSPAKELSIDPHPMWMDAAHIPEQVQEKATDCHLVITSDQWAALTPLQRFALIKLSRPSHENRNFLPAFQEFQHP